MSGKGNSAKAGLKFPVGRMKRYLRKDGYAKRVASGAPVYLAAVLEYVCEEILHEAGEAAKNKKKSRITPRYIQRAIRDDDQLNQLLSGTTVAFGGVI